MRDYPRRPIREVWGCFTTMYEACRSEYPGGPECIQPPLMAFWNAFKLVVIEGWPSR